MCVARYDLGENLRVVLLATTEAEDKPSKYPPLFQSSDVFIITKTDLTEAVEFDCAAALKAMRELRSDVPIFEISARKNRRMSGWVSHLLAGRERAVPAKV